MAALPSVNIVLLDKGDEHFIYMFSDANKAGILQMLGGQAMDPQLNFDWQDAAQVSRQIRALMSEDQANGGRSR